MRALVGLALVVALLAAVQASASTAKGPTSLRIAYWEDGAKATPDEIWTLRCDPARGTHPRPRLACRRIAAGGARLFAGVPKDMACTQIWGGPQKARIVGTVQGSRVWTIVTRSDGCQIGRWNALSPWLLPPGGATS